MKYTKMKILGIRNCSEGIRYCILEIETSGDVICKNLDKENLIQVPKEYENCEDMLIWYKNEINRIIDSEIDVNSIALKHNENVRSDCYSNLKKVMFMDCIVTLIAKERGVSFASYGYNQLGVNSKNVQVFAESKLGKTKKHWNKNMADAIVVALKQKDYEV